MSDKKLFLLDGHALVYRAHYAFINRPLINSKGLNTSAINGFVRTLWDLISNQKPSHLALVFDPKGPTFRHEYYPEYKANRDATPEDITIAIPHVRSIVEAFNIPVICIDNYEADDVIGTLAKQAEKEGFDVYMVTPDKDYAQLVSDHVFMYKPARMGNGIDILGRKEVLEKFDIERPEQVIDFLGLQGDSVDNIPGIPGVGAKTAVKFLKAYGSMENLLANTHELKGKQKENVEKYAEQGLMSKRLATIKLDVPVTFDAKAYEIEGFDRAKLKELFKEFEFRSLAKSILGEDTKTTEQASLFADLPHDAETSKAYAIGKKNLETEKTQYELVSTKEGREKLAATLESQKFFCFDTETTGLNAHQVELVGIAFSWGKGKGYYVNVSEDMVEAKKEVAVFQRALQHPIICKVGQNLKYDINILRWYDIEVKGPFFDTMIAHYLLEPDLRHKLDYLSESYLSYSMVPIEKLIGKRGPKQKTMRSVELEALVDYAVEDADITMQLRDILSPKVKEHGVQTLFDDVEMPLIGVLSRMEYQGINLNKEFLNDYSKVLEKDIFNVRKKIYDHAGQEFNINSPRQVGEILFDVLEIPYRWRRTKTGQYSTDVDKLTELSFHHKIIADILEYRMYSKLKSTYVDALPLMINPRTGRIHSSFNQARAATGRLSSENPNLQNIPIKNAAGREIRKAFIPRDKDHILLAADYSQVELRLIAEISKDEAMLEAFSKGHDIHKATAAGVYNVSLDEVTAEQRRNAKTVNFSIIYGAGSTNLSRQLGLSRGEAKELIENYFNTYKGLKIYMDKTVANAREHGYVETLIGRKRSLRDINSRNSLARSNAERMAINTPIQGTAADMIKIAMINIDEKMYKANYKSKMILQVHDELVFDVYHTELEEIKALVQEEMKNAIPGLEVPILVESGTGQNWLEAH
ncbi:MAG: DNA polymerase-1 [Saprospiraceae bacterium]|jgi:DNA polymerase-1